MKKMNMVAVILSCIMFLMAGTVNAQWTTDGGNESITSGNASIGTTNAPSKLHVVRGTDLNISPTDAPSMAETYDCPNTADWSFLASECAVIVTSVSTGDNNIGIASMVQEGTKLNMGGAFSAGSDDAEFNIGVHGSGGGVDADRGWGVWGDAIADETYLNIGVAGIIDNCNGTGSSSSRFNYGVYGSCDDDALSPPHTNWGGYFNGSVMATGGYSSVSDRQFKKDLSPLSDIMEKINQLKFYTYNFKTEEYPQIHLASGTHYGLIAQDLEKVFPELVVNTKHHKETVNGKVYPAFDYKAVKMDELIPLALQAIQELDKKIELLKTAGTTGISPVGSLSAASLEQNAPNPFTSNTVIRYSIPQDVSSSLLLIVNINGEVVYKQQNIPGGKQSISIQGGDLASGTYFYSLFCDNECVATKKMILLD